MVVVAECSWWCLRYRGDGGGFVGDMVVVVVLQWLFGIVGHAGVGASGGKVLVVAVEAPIRWLR